MVILEPDGTLTHDGSQPYTTIERVGDRLAHPSEHGTPGVRYSFDVPGLGMVALQIEPEAAGASAGVPRHFTAVTMSLG